MHGSEGHVRDALVATTSVAVTASPLPEPDLVRGAVRGRCGEDDPIALEDLRATHFSVHHDGWVRALYEGRRADGPVLRVTARRVGDAKGRRLEAQITARNGAAGHAPDLGVLFQLFPTDLRLPSLAVASDGAAMAPVLEGVLGRGATARQVGVEVVRYKPEHKCLLRYDIAWAGEETAELPRVVYGKVSRPSTFDRVRHTLGCLGGASDAIAFALPASLGVVPDLGMELMSRVPGVRLDTLVERADFADLCGRAGAGLRQFHRLPVVLGHGPDRTETTARVAGPAAERARRLGQGRARIA